MPYPSLETIQALAASGEYRAAPVSIELLADERTPIEVLRILKNVSDRCFLLESAEDAERWGRYTFLGFDPKLTVSCRDGNMTVGDRHCRTEHPATYIRELLREYKSPRIPGLPPFTGGLVGYFSFEYLRCAEPSLRREDGEADRADPPAVVLQHALERRPGVDVADQPDRRRVEVGRDPHRGLLGPGQDGLDAEVVVQRLAPQVREQHRQQRGHQRQQQHPGGQAAVRVGCEQRRQNRQ